MRIALILCSLLCVAGGAAAQTVEVGGRVGTGCKGSEDSLCSGGTGVLFGGHVSWWANERVELSSALTRVTLPTTEFRFNEIEVFTTDRKRDFVSLLFIYHFLEGRPVRPMLGIGSGWYADASRTGCRPAGCETVLRNPGGPLLGQYRAWDIDAVFVVGLSGMLTDRWVIRGAWQSHRFGNEENMTQQFFTAVGYRFGR